MVLLVAAALTGWGLVKHCGGGGLAEREIRAGIALTADGIATRRVAQFRQAEDHYVDAASVTVLSSYPAFVLHVNRELEAAVSGGEVPSPIIAALLAQDWAEARRGAARTGAPETKPREYWERFIDELVSAARAPRGGR